MTDNNRDIIKERELDVLLKQYDSVRTEINLETSAQNNIINFSIGFIAATFIIFGLKINDNNLFIEKYPLILLIISIFQIFITWTALEAEFAIHELRAFVHNELSTQIKNNIGSTFKSDYFKMELALNSKKNTFRTIVRGLLVSAKFLIPFVHAIIMFVVFCYSFESFSKLSTMDLVIFIFTILLLLTTPIIFVIHVRFVSKYYNLKK